MKYLSSIGAIGKQLPKVDENPLPCMGGIELTDTWGLYNIKMSSHDRNITISSPFGDVKMNALTGISISAPNGNIKISGKNVEIHASNRLSVTSGENIKNGGYFACFSKKGLEKNIGTGIGKVITGVTGLDKWLDFSILRTLLEIVIRPVDGTLELKSYRYLLMEAGGGEACIEPRFYKEGYDQNARAFSFTELKLFLESFEPIGGIVDAFVRDFITKYNAAANALANFTDEDIAPGDGAADEHKKIQVPANKNKLIEDLAAKKDIFEVFSYVRGMTFSVLDDYDYIASVETKCSTLYNAIKAVRNHAATRSTLLNDLDTNLQHVFGYKYFGALFRALKDELKYNTYSKVFESIISDATNRLGQDLKELDRDHFAAVKPDNTYDTEKQTIKRKFAHSIITRYADQLFKTIEVKSDATNPTPFNNNDSWAHFRASIQFSRSEDFVNELLSSTVGSMLSDNPADMEKNIWTYEGDIWGVSAVGEILFANKDAKTYRFITGGSHLQSYDNPDYINGFQEDFKRLIEY